MSKVVTDVSQLNNLLTEQGIELVTFEHNCFYDLALSQILFQDFKIDLGENAQFYSDKLRNGTDYLVIFASNEIRKAKHFKISHLHKMKRDELLKLCAKIDWAACDDDATKQDCIDFLMQIDNEDFYNNHYSENNWRDLEYDYSVSGYMQGDIVKVKVVGDLSKSDYAYITSDYLTNIFYDTPLYCRISINVNGKEVEELYIDEHFKSLYDAYEKNVIIDIIKTHYSEHKYYEQLLEYVQANFPNDVKYV